MEKAILEHLDAIIALCKKHKVEAISLFGAAAKNAMTDQSDIDFLIQFSKDLDVLDYADNYFAFLEALEKLTGRNIDLLSVNSLNNPVLREEILKTKIDLYAA